MPYRQALEAFGSDGVSGTRYADVPLDQIVGSVARADDFTDEFRLLNRGLQRRWHGLARAMTAGVEPPPIDLIQLGELYFVVDGHHRVSVSKAMGRYTMSATVTTICTIAYAMCCLRLAHLESKAAERRFLERVPLPDEVRAGLWLDEPAQWSRLADSAEAWGFRQSLSGRLLTRREELATAWWDEEVRPAVDRLRSGASDRTLRDVQLYATAVAAREHVNDARN